MILNDSIERRRFFRFAIVGAIGTVIDFSVFNLLTSAFSLPAVPSSVVSFTVAVISNFIWNRLWTYPESRSKPFGIQLAQFGLVSVGGLVIRTPLFAVLEKGLISLAERWLPDFFLSPTVVGHNIGLAISIVVVLLWNFFANRYWTFRDSPGVNKDHVC